MWFGPLAENQRRSRRPGVFSLFDIVTAQGNPRVRTHKQQQVVNLWGPHTENSVRQSGHVGRPPVAMLCLPQLVTQSACIM